MFATLNRIFFGRRSLAGSMPALPSGERLVIGCSANRIALVGGSVWPMAAALCQHLLRDRATIFRSPGVSTLELGSGTGAVGLFAAGLGAGCTLSEQRPARAAAQPVSYAPDGESSISLDELPGQSDSLLDLLRQNVADNGRCFAIPPAVMELDFTDAAHVKAASAASPTASGFSLILGSDITYSSNQHAHLATAIARLLRKPTSPSASEGGIALIAHEQRLRSLVNGADVQLASFVAAAGEAGLHVEVSPLDVPDAGSSGSLIRLSWPHRGAGGKCTNG